MAIERILDDSGSDINLRKRTINMALQSLSNMMTNNLRVVEQVWPQILQCSFMMT